MLEIKYIIKESLLFEGRREDVYNKYLSIYEAAIEAKIQNVTQHLDELERLLKVDENLPEIVKRSIVKTRKNWTTELNIILQSKSKFLEHYNDVFNFFVQNDPSGNLKYLDWTIKNWISNQEFINLDFMVELVKDFNTLQQRIKSEGYSTDINQYDIERLIVIIRDVKNKPTKADLKKESEKIYEDQNWLVVRPLSHKASCFYGAGTQWCTTSKDEPSYYASYTTKDKLLIYIIQKKTNKKLAIYKDNKNNLHTFDSRDNEIPEEWFSDPTLPLYHMEDEYILYTKQGLINLAINYSQHDPDSETILKNGGDKAFEKALEVLEEEISLYMEPYRTEHIPLPPKEITEKIGLRFNTHTEEMKSTMIRVDEVVKDILENRVRLIYGLRTNTTVISPIGMEIGGRLYKYSSSDLKDIICLILDPKAKEHGWLNLYVRDRIKKYIDSYMGEHYSEFYDERRGRYLDSGGEDNWPTLPETTRTYDGPEYYPQE